MVRQVMDYEEQAREVLLRDAPTSLEDKVWRAFGLLRYARTLSFEEAMNLLSGVRLGVGMNAHPRRRHVHAEQAAGHTRSRRTSRSCEGMAPGRSDLPVRRAAHRAPGARRRGRSTAMSGRLGGPR